MRRAQDRARGPERTERDDRIARPRRAQTCERSELRAKRMCECENFFIYFIIDSH